MSLFSHNKKDDGEVVEIMNETAESIPETHEIPEVPVTSEAPVISETPEETADIPEIQIRANGQETENKAATEAEIKSDAESYSNIHEDEAMLNFAKEQEKTEIVSEVKTKQAAATEEDKTRKAEKKVNTVNVTEAKAYTEDTSHTAGIIRTLIYALIAIILLVGAYSLGRNNAFSSEQKVTPVPTAGGSKAETTVFTIADLKSYVSEINTEDIAPFTASVKDYFGYEYLCLSSDEIKVYYRNEFPEDYADAKTIVIDNGTFRTEMYFDYDLTGSIKSLVPKLGSYAGDSSRQLVIADYEDDFPSKLWFIDADRLFNYGCVDIEESMENIYNIDFAENEEAEDDSRRYLMTFVFSSSLYTYAVSKETYYLGDELNEDVIDYKNAFELAFSDEGITFTAQIRSSEDEYLGLAAGSIVKNDDEFIVSGMKFGAYAIASEAGYSSDGAITPRPAPFGTYITILGKTGLRYYIPISDEIDSIDIDWANVVTNDDGTMDYVVDGQVVSKRGIDVSKFQGSIDWEKVKAAGYEFAIIRLGYRGYGQGTLELDANFEDNIKGATEAGLKVGVYFFSEAITVEEAVEEAEFVMENIKDYTVDYPVVFDTEDIATADARANNLSYELRTEICRAFCDEIKNAGYTPMIYANSRFMLTAIDLTKLDDIDRWFAYYGTTSQFPYSFKILQYSESGTVDGITGKVDLDMSFVDYGSEENE